MRIQTDRLSAAYAIIITCARPVFDLRFSKAARSYSRRVCRAEKLLLVQGGADGRGNEPEDKHARSSNAPRRASSQSSGAPDTLYVHERASFTTVKQEARARSSHSRRCSIRHKPGGTGTSVCARRRKMGARRAQVARAIAYAERCGREASGVGRGSDGSWD